MEMSMQENTLQDIIDDTQILVNAVHNPQQSIQQSQSTSEFPSFSTLDDVFAHNPELKKQYEIAVDRERTTASKTARRNAIEEQKRLADDRLTRAQKIELLRKTPGAVEEFLLGELEEREMRESKRESVERMNNDVLSFLEEFKIPGDIFRLGLDYYAMDDESLDKRKHEFSKYEYFPKGSFDKKVQEAVAIKVAGLTKEDPPQLHAQQGLNNPKSIELTPIESY